MRIAIVLKAYLYLLLLSIAAIAVCTTFAALHRMYWARECDFSGPYSNRDLNLAWTISSTAWWKDCIFRDSSKILNYPSQPSFALETPGRKRYSPEDVPLLRGPSIERMLPLDSALPQVINEIDPIIGDHVVRETFIGWPVCFVSAVRDVHKPSAMFHDYGSNSGTVYYKVWWLNLVLVCMVYIVGMRTLCLLVHRCISMRAEYRSRRGKCVRCGYLINMSPLARCPECGLSIKQFDMQLKRQSSNI